jgi:nucleoprotein TPR
LELQSLQEKLRAVETELSNSVQKMNEMQQQLESERNAFAADKKTLEETIVDISSSAANNQADETERVNIIKVQEERITVRFMKKPKFTSKDLSFPFSRLRKRDIKEKLSLTQRLSRQSTA